MIDRHTVKKLGFFNRLCKDFDGGFLIPSRRFAVILGGSVASLLIAPQAQAETLAETYQLAHASDPKFRAAQADARASGTAIDQARAGFLPVVKLDLEQSTTRQKIVSSENPVIGVGQTSYPTSSQTISLTQPIYRKDAFERFAQSKSVVRQSELTLLAAEQDLLLRTTAAYLSVLAANDSLALAVAERESLGLALDLAREELKMGLGTITSQHDASARFAVTQAREIEAANKLRDAKQSLREITGKAIESYQSMRSDFPLAKPVPENEETWVQAALDQNASLRARQEAVTIASQEVDRLTSAHYPTLDMVLSFNRRDTGSTLFGGGSNVQTTDALLRLNVPLYEGGLTSSVISEARFRLERTQDELEQERRAVERATRAAYQGVLSGIGLIRAVGQSVASQERAVEAKGIGLKAGVYTMLAVLDAQRDLYIAKRDHAQSRYDFLMNALKLKQAAGTLSETDLLDVYAALQ
jgi:outer membrane protein